MVRGVTSCEGRVAPFSIVDRLLSQQNLLPSVQCMNNIVRAWRGRS